MARDLEGKPFAFFRGAELKDFKDTKWEECTYKDQATGEIRKSVAMVVGDVRIHSLKTGLKVEMRAETPEMPTKTAKRAQ